MSSLTSSRVLAPIGTAGKLFAFGLDVAGGVVTRVHSMLNPDKLAHLGPVGDLTSLLRSAR